MPAVGAAWAASLCLYAAVLLAAAVVLGRGKPRAVAARVPVVFVAVHFGFAWGFWKEVCRQVRARLSAAPRTSAPRAAAT